MYSPCACYPCRPALGCLLAGCDHGQDHVCSCAEALHVSMCLILACRPAMTGQQPHRQAAGQLPSTLTRRCLMTVPLPWRYISCQYPGPLAGAGYLSLALTHGTPDQEST